MVNRCRAPGRLAGLVRAALALSLPAVAACGSGGDPSQRIYDLGREPTAENIEQIRGYLESEASKDRAAAMFKLVDLKVPDSLDLALGGLEDEDGFVRATAAKLLGDLEDPAAVPALVDHLGRDPDPVVRQRAAEALTVLAGPQAEESLVRALQDPLARVRLAATRGVSDLAPGRALDALVQLLLEDPEWEIRAQAARGLGRSGARELAPALEAALQDRNEFVRAAAAHALEEIGADQRSRAKE